MGKMAYRFFEVRTSPFWSEKNRAKNLFPTTKHGLFWQSMLCSVNRSLLKFVLRITSFFTYGSQISWMENICSQYSNSFFEHLDFDFLTRMVFQIAPMVDHCFHRMFTWSTCKLLMLIEMMIDPKLHYSFQLYMVYCDNPGPMATKMWSHFWNVSKQAGKRKKTVALRLIVWVIQQAHLSCWVILCLLHRLFKTQSHMSTKYHGWGVFRAPWSFFNHYHRPTKNVSWYIPIPRLSKMFL